MIAPHYATSVWRHLPCRWRTYALGAFGGLYALGSAYWFFRCFRRPYSSTRLTARRKSQVLPQMVATHAPGVAASRRYCTEVRRVGRGGRGRSAVRLGSVPLASRPGVIMDVHLLDDRRRRHVDEVVSFETSSPSLFRSSACCSHDPFLPIC